MPRNVPPDSWIRDVRRKLLRWYGRTARDLPWRRRSGDPYAQWVAEVMLQQTQAETVIPYYGRFLQRFPDVATLAAAGLDDVLSLWQGLGYYRRAENLHRTAGLLAGRKNGWPRAVEEWMALPGIGRYTAGAIASMACGQRAAAVDGNAVRVLSRLAGIEADPAAATTLAEIWSLAERLLPVARRAGDFNQALMDLGAGVCRATGPDCERCPVKGECLALARGIVDRIPASRRRSGPSEEYRIVLAVLSDGQLLMRQRPRGGRWSGLWELPNTPGRPLEAGRALRNLCKELKLTLPGGIAFCEHGSLTHRLTHRLYRFAIHSVVVDPESRPKGRRGFRWVRMPISVAALPGGNGPSAASVAVG